MAGKVIDNRPISSFDFELVEDDSDHLTAALASANQNGPWVDPTRIKLRHRIGRGPFGDVWLATYHNSTEDYKHHREVAVKMLHQIKEDNANNVLNRLGDLFSKCQNLESLCWLHGYSIINGKLCIVMKFYEDSVGDKMTRLKGGKLSLHDVLRYGIDLAQGIMDLHSKDILVLNLKPFNFLLNENDQAIIGDIGIPYILLGIPLLGSNMTLKLGSPNYMAPEQWQPETRGPISFETDSWGFGCSIVEMLTGIQPWSGKSVDAIYESVVKRLETPHIPDGLPPALENIIIGCFKYDLRSRPVMRDILESLRSCQNAVCRDESWTGLGGRMITERSGGIGYSEWLLKKDHPQVGDVVRSRKPPNSCKPENMDVPEGTVVGLERDTDRNGYLLVRVHGIHDPIRVDERAVERVTFGMAAGDWVRLKKQDKKHSPVGILHSIDRDGSVAVGFIGVETLWMGHCSELQMAKPCCPGQFVRLKPDVFSPRFEWPRRNGGEWATGRICQVLPNGCLLVRFPGRLTFGDDNSCFLADPAEVEVVSFETCPTIVKKYQHLEDFHWAMRPLLIAVGLFTAIKLGRRLIGGRSTVKKEVVKNGVLQIDRRHVDGQSAAGSAWIPPKVANIIHFQGRSC